MDNPLVASRRLPTFTSVMKYIIALGFALVASVSVGFVLAVILGICNIYLTGHGINWPSEEFRWRFISMSLLDVVLLSGCILAFLSVGGIVLWGMSRNSSPGSAGNE